MPIPRPTPLTCTLRDRPGPMGAERLVRESAVFKPVSNDPAPPIHRLNCFVPGAGGRGGSRNPPPRPPGAAQPPYVPGFRRTTEGPPSPHESSSPRPERIPDQTESWDHRRFLPSPPGPTQGPFFFIRRHTSRRHRAVPKRAGGAPGVPASSGPTHKQAVKRPPHSPPGKART